MTTGAGPGPGGSGEPQGAWPPIGQPQGEAPPPGEPQPQSPSPGAPAGSWTPQPQPSGSTEPLQPAAPPPAPPPAPRRRIRLRWTVLGALVVLAGIGGFQIWQREQTYQTGHTAYLAGDCSQAVGPLRAVAEPESGSNRNDTALRAAEELEECDALLAAADLGTQDKPGEAVLAFEGFTVKYPQSPLAAHAVRQGAALLAADPAKSATTDLCDALEGLEEKSFVTTPADTLPPLLHACGAAYEEDDAFGEALAAYARFRDEYPEHDLAAEVDEAYARTAIADAEAADAGEIQAPDATDEGGSEGLATILIQNGTTDVLNLVFSGPDVRIEDLEPCDACGPPATAAEVCEIDGPTAEYLVEPGTYQVVVRSGRGASVLPFRGTWTLAAGQVYPSCFYISRG